MANLSEAGRTNNWEMIVEMAMPGNQLEQILFCEEVMLAGYRLVADVNIGEGSSIVKPTVSGAAIKSRHQLFVLALGSERVCVHDRDKSCLVYNLTSAW